MSWGKWVMVVLLLASCSQTKSGQTGFYGEIQGGVVSTRIF